MEEWAEMKSLVTEIRAAGPKAPATGRWRSRLVRGRWDMSGLTPRVATVLGPFRGIECGTGPPVSKPAQALA